MTEAPEVTAAGAGDDAEGAPGHDAALARAVDDNFRLQVLAFGHITPRGAASLSDRAVAAHCGFPSVFNRATALDWDQPDVTLTEVARFFGDLPHTLWLAEDALPEDGDVLLRERGYVPMSPLAGVARALPADDLPVRDEHQVRLLTDPSLAPQVADVVSTGFGFGVDDRLVFEDLIRNVLRITRPFNHGAVYGRVADEVTAVGMLLCTADLAGLSTIATRPAHRHQGLATAIVARALNDAHALGYGTSGAVTNPDSGPLLAELGYRRVSTYHVYRQARR